MQRLLSLFSDIQQDPDRPPSDSGRPPDPPGPDYDREPEYFRNLLDYLRMNREPGDASGHADPVGLADDYHQEVGA